MENVKKTEKEPEKRGFWVYEYDRRYPSKYELSEVRYVLGEIFDTSIPKALICIGINPSTAIPEDLDYTLSRVQTYAKRGKEYGAWYMLNIYPQRSTDPTGMHHNDNFNAEIHARNIVEIKKLLDGVKEYDVWCAWGETITISDKDYLPKLLCGKDDEKIDGILPLFGSSHVLKAYGLTKEGHHPGHPRVMPKNANLKDLDSLLKERKKTLESYKESLFPKKHDKTTPTNP